MFAGSIDRALTIGLITLGMTTTVQANTPSFDDVNLLETRSNRVEQPVASNGPGAWTGQSYPYTGQHTYQTPTWGKGGGSVYTGQNYPYTGQHTYQTPTWGKGGGSVYTGQTWYPSTGYDTNQTYWNGSSWCATPQVNDWMYRRYYQQPTYQQPSYERWTYERYNGGHTYPTYRYPTQRYPTHRYPSYRYPRRYSHDGGAGRQFANGISLGNGIGHIITGRRYGDDLETAGGALTTVGSIFQIISDARNY